MIISVHVPKTAGTAFGLVLKQKFGERLLEDYGDRPLSHSAPRRIADAIRQLPDARRHCRGYDAVHGHFLAIKYVAAGGDVVTWLREPMQRVVSRYEHYRRDVREGRPLQRVRGLRPGLSLEEFIELPRFQNTYGKYFRFFPLQRIRWIGFSDSFEASLARMAEAVGVDLGPPVRANVNPHRPQQAAYDVHEHVARRIRRLNEGDYRIWHWALDRFA